MQQPQVGCSSFSHLIDRIRKNSVQVQNAAHHSHQQLFSKTVRLADRIGAANTPGVTSAAAAQV